MILNLSDQPSVAHEIIRQLRDTNIQSEPTRFRTNLRRLGQLLAYEVSKTLDYQEVEVETSLGVAKCLKMQDRIILATILRAGHPLHQGLLDFFGQAENAFIASYRQHHKDGTFEIAMEYATYPNVDNATVIIADAMIATGSSIEQAIQTLTNEHTPKSIHVVAAIACTQGIDRLQRIYPECNIWAGAIDDELTAKSYIVPGLGDAGDLAFGQKDQA